MRATQHLTRRLESRLRITFVHGVDGDMQQAEREEAGAPEALVVQIDGGEEKKEAPAPAPAKKKKFLLATLPHRRHHHHHAGVSFLQTSMTSRRALALAVTIQVSRHRKRFQPCWLGTFGCTSLFQSVLGPL